CAGSHGLHERGAWLAGLLLNCGHRDFLREWVERAARLGAGGLFIPAESKKIKRSGLRTNRRAAGVMKPRCDPARRSGKRALGGPSPDRGAAPPLLSRRRIAPRAWRPPAPRCK